MSFCVSILYADTNDRLKMIEKYLMENDSTYVSKNTPDIFDGFRQFKFYTPITDYFFEHIYHDNNVEFDIWLKRINKLIL